MMLMSKILGISIFVPDLYSTVFIRLNSILTLSLNQGGCNSIAWKTKNSFESIISVIQHYNKKYHQKLNHF